MIGVTRIRADELTDHEVACWAQLQRANPHLASPFFCPEYTLAVAAARADIYVGILREGSRIVGFFPFQCERRGVAQPVGGSMADYDGIVSEPELQQDVRALMRGCGLAILDFRGVPTSQKAFEPYRRLDLISPVIDLSGGYDAYLAEKDRYSAAIVQLMRKARKIQREVGPLRFIANVPEFGALRTVLRWKTDQYLRMGVPDLFAAVWPVRVAENVLETHRTGFGGILSVLYAGEEIVAMHFGLRSSRVWHYWFPVYDPRYSAYSPGLLLLLRMAEAAPSLGLDTIDFGVTARLASYKHRFMNASVPVWRGSVERASLPTAARVARRVYAQQLGWVQRAVSGIGRRRAS